MTIAYGNVRARITSARESVESSAVQLHLEKHSVMSLTPNQPNSLLRCWSGRLWVTRKGDEQDYFLSAGDIFPIPQAGHIVLEAMEEATLSISGA